jgi:hypothetical protein
MMSPVSNIYEAGSEWGDLALSLRAMLYVHKQTMATFSGIALI